MPITNTDVLKLTVPFISAVFLIWVRNWVQNRISRNVKQEVMSRLLQNEIHDLREVIETLERVKQSFLNGHIRLVTVEVPRLLSKYACDLAELDPSRAFQYSDFSASCEIARKGLEKLSTFILERSKTTEEQSIAVLVEVIGGQAQITAKDLLECGELSLRLIKNLPKKQRAADDQTISNLEKDLKDSENIYKNWIKKTKTPTI